MADREKVIKHFEHLLNAAKGNYQDFVDLTVDAGEEILELLKEQEEIKEQFIEAFNTIRDAYNVPANREKILLNYLMRNACCCADGERKEGR